MRPVRPMLAESVVDIHDLRYPLMASTKLDGIRCLIHNGVALSRTLKPIPNKFVQEFFAGRPELNGLDGELMLPAKFNEISSLFMSKDKPLPYEWFFAVFDEWQEPERTFRDRMFTAALKVSVARTKHVTLVQQSDILTPEDLEGFERTAIAMDFEGVMLRDPFGTYKQGRSTLKEQKLLKLKRFVDGEASIVGFIEMMHNDNAQTRDNLGLAKRSHKLSGLRGAGMLGALAVRDVLSGVEFEIGTGFSEALRQKIWSQQDRYRSQLVKYKRFEPGTKDKPRHPVFLGFRHPDDM